MFAGFHTVPIVFSAPLTSSFNRELPTVARLLDRPTSSYKWRPPTPTDSLSVRRFIASRTSAQDLSLPEDTADPAGTFPKLKRGSNILPIHTLDPSRLTEDDYIDFSLRARPTLCIKLHLCGSTDSPVFRSSRSLQFTAPSWSSHRFPPDTRGFMYYHVPPNGPLLAGELRFRLTSSRDPASFTTGADLLTERSLPWRYPLYKIVLRRDYQRIVSLLLQDGLVSQRTLDLVTAAVPPLYPATTNAPRRRAAGVALSALDARHPALLASTPVLSAFGQEFDLHFSADLNFCAVFASQDAFLTHHLRKVMSFRVMVEGKYVDCSPFKGSVVCCFERSTLPEHAGRRIVVIRIKRFIDSDPILDVPAPVNLDARRTLQVEELRPRVGELLKTTGHHRSVKPWAADVDKVCKGGRTGTTVPWKAFRVLFENEELYGPSREA